MERVPLLTTAQVGEQLGMTANAVCHYINRKRNPMPHINLGDVNRPVYRVRQDALDEWLEGQEVAA